jgi:hypothetical protein
MRHKVLKQLLEMEMYFLTLLKTFRRSLLAPNYLFTNLLINSKTQKRNKKYLFLLTNLTVCLEENQLIFLIFSNYLVHQ